MFRGNGICEVLCTTCAWNHIDQDGQYAQVMKPPYDRKWLGSSSAWTGVERVTDRICFFDENHQGQTTIMQDQSPRYQSQSCDHTTRY